MISLGFIQHWYVSARCMGDLVLLTGHSLQENETWDFGQSDWTNESICNFQIQCDIYSEKSGLHLIFSSLHSHLHGIIMFVYHHIGCLYSYFSKLRFYSVLVCLCYCVPCTFLSLVEGILEIHSIERNYFDRWNQNYLFERESKRERKKFSHMEFIVFNWWNG